MKYAPTLRKSLLVFSLSLASVPTWAGDDCDAPVNRWQSREALQQWATAQGWQVQRVKIDDGCYEIRATDAQGRAFKAKIDPETLKVVKMKQGKHARARERDTDEEGKAPPAPPAQAQGVTAPAPLSPPRTATRAQIE